MILYIHTTTNKLFFIFPPYYKESKKQIGMSICFFDCVSKSIKTEEKLRNRKKYRYILHEKNKLRFEKTRENKRKQEKNKVSKKYFKKFKKSVDKTLFLYYNMKS